MATVLKPAILTLRSSSDVTYQIERRNLPIEKKKHHFLGGIGVLSNLPTLFVFQL